MEEKNGLTKVFKNSIAQVLDFLIIHEGWDYNKKEIAEHSKVAYKTVYNIWPIFEKHKIIKQTRVIGRAKMYSINKESKIVKQLKKLQTNIMLQALEEQEEESKKPVHSIALA